MALRTILIEGEDTLTRKSREVVKFDERLHELLDDMTETMNDANGVGLAAPQVGILRRIVVVHAGEEVLELINPEILETSGEQDGLEGCLSIPGRFGLVKRPMVVKVRAQDRFGDWYEAEGEGLIARAFCHEIEHLDGILYNKRAYKMLTQQELEEYYEEDDE